MYRFVCIVVASHSATANSVMVSGNVFPYYSLYCVIVFLKVVPLGGPYQRIPILWASKLQTEIALSSTESEYIFLSKGLQEIIPLMRLIHELTDQPRSFSAREISPPQEIYNFGRRRKFARRNSPLSTKLRSSSN